MRTYYNDNDLYAAQWLKNLIEAGHLPAGDVDTRSIEEVKPSEVKGYTQAHFFAGIGGWPLALKIAGWSDDRSVWTGSCPCQPLSSAGKRQGERDERHLWPAFYKLIAKCRPPAIFGEQVAGSLGLEWIAAIQADLEQANYAFGSAELPASSLEAPHTRNRMFWLANTNGADYWRHLHCSDETNRSRQAVRFSGDSSVDKLSSWRDIEWLDCADGKSRPTQPGIHPLAHGIPGRVGQLRAYGNAIVPQVAATFIRAFMDIN